jgi:hypothetical protein
MSGSISFNPYATTSPANSFLSPTQGYVQGLALDDPSSRMWLVGGQLASTETVTMWGGIPISQEINQLGTSSEGLGPLIKRATASSNTTGWSVFNQASSMVITPGNTVPLAGTGNYVSFYRSGSGQVRIPVRCDAALVAALTSTELINAPVLYWDVTNYQITLTTTGGNWALPTSIQLLSVNTNSKIVTYTSASSVTWSTGDAAVIAI